MAYEGPTYCVEERIGEIELRRYKAYLVAETLVRGPLEDAGNDGFRLLAGYIFGGNKTADGGSSKISMTTPVTQDRVGDQYRVRFAMPSEYTGDLLPVPNDLRVTISAIAPQYLAAIRYRGRWSRSRYEQHLRKLSEALQRSDHTAVGEPIWARYDPPWTPWFLRRNEVLVAIDDGSPESSAE
ncbi:heme-binding protein [bacterium]|nr:heme-binding protein [bacterium]